MLYKTVFTTWLSYHKLLLNLYAIRELNDKTRYLYLPLTDTPN